MGKMSFISPELKFDKLMKKANLEIKKNNFTKALILYHQIKEQFDKIKDIRESRRKSFDILVKELAAYVDINEVYVLAQQEDDPIHLKLLLDHIGDLEKDLVGTAPKNLLRFVDKNYKMYLKINNLRLTKSKINKLVQKLENQIDQGKFEDAIRSYSEIVASFRRSYFKFNGDERHKLRYKLHKMHKALSVHKMIKKAYDKPKKIKCNFRRIYSESEKKINPFRHEIPRQYIKFSSKYDRIRKLLKQGKANEAKVLLAEIE